MKLRTLCFFLIVLLPITAAAQFTQVSATVTDPNSLPYANGTVVAKLILPGGTSPTLNGLAYTPPSQPVGLNSAGFFLMQIADNNVLLPAATQWTFTVCSAAGTVQPAGGRGPVCFTAGPITITGASQSITATLNAAALALTISTGGATINPTNNVLPYRVNATTFGDSQLTNTASGFSFADGTVIDNLSAAFTTAGVHCRANALCTITRNGAASLTLSDTNSPFGGSGGLWGLINNQTGVGGSEAGGILVGVLADTAATACNAGSPVKIDTANDNAVVPTVTTDTGSGIVIGVVSSGGCNQGVAHYTPFLSSGLAAMTLGTGTCTRGQFVIVDTTTNQDVKCTSTYTAGTVIGVATTAQAVVGNTLNVLIGLR